MASNGTVERKALVGPRVALPAADPGALDLTLLDGDRLTAHLNRPARVRYLDHRPGRRLLLQAELLDGRPGSPRDEVLLVITPGAVAVHRLPVDPWLPQLACTVDELRTALVAAGLADPGPGCSAARLAYLPGRQVTRRLGDLVLKSYADPADHATAWTALTVVHACGGLPVPAPVVSLDGRLTTVQRFSPGRPVAGADAVAVADRAGLLLRRWQRTEIRLGTVNGPAAQLTAAERAVQVVEAVLPEQGARARRLLEQLRRTAPSGLALVPSHGDFTCGQLLDRSAAPGPTGPDDDSGLVVVDVDTAALAPAATDPAAYAANLSSGRPGDADRTLEALDRLLQRLGHCPPALVWHLKVALLRRSDRAFRRFKKDWPDRTVRILDGVQDAA